MTNAVERLANPNIPTPAHLGQATAIEQSRAVAEVQAAVVVAQQRPRNIDGAVEEMKRACAQPGLAERAFYSFPRSGETVSGPSVYLARELARCFGNIQYGIHELRRDDAAGISEMQAFAWDLERNTRSAQIFIVPHTRDTKRGPTRLTQLRDVYENNANAGARRVREAIFSVLPVWFTAEAQDLCRQTLELAAGASLPQQIAKAVHHFATLDVTPAQLERRIGRPRDKWTPRDVADLGILAKSLSRREITREEAFPDSVVELADVTGKD